MEPKGFFRMLYPPSVDEGWLTIWERQDKATYFFPANQEGIEAASQEALALDGQRKDVYFGIGLRRENLGVDKRGAVKDIAGIPGLWADVDCKEGIHSSDALPTKDEAREFLMSLPHPPSAIVDSGGGYHAYWVFDSGFLPTPTKEDRDRVGKQTKMFHTALAALMAEKNWKLDNTSDLPRVLRVPGTRNWKTPSEPRPVEAIEVSDRRYSLDVLVSWAQEIITEKKQQKRREQMFATPTQIDTEAVTDAVRQHWGPGERHANALALAGFLAKRGVPQEVTEAVFQKVMEIAGDGDTRDRMRIVSDTYAKVVAGEEVAGKSALPETLAEKLDVLVPMPDRVGRILDDLDGNWPNVFKQEFLRRLAALNSEELARFLAEVKARGGGRVVTASKLEKIVAQTRRKIKTEERGWEVVDGGGDPSAGGVRTIVGRFPPAIQIVPEKFPLPMRAKKSEYWDIRNGQVVKVEIGNEGFEITTPILDTVILLAQRFAPIEADTGIEKWTVAWWEKDHWRYADCPARWLFDNKKVGELIDLGIPVSSDTANDLVIWFDGLRSLAVLGHQNAPELPTVRGVTRCGWYEIEGERIMVWGREVLSAHEKKENEEDEDTEGDDAAKAEGCGGNAEDDIRWTDDISPLERQILGSFAAKGDMDTQIRFLLDTMTKYPQIAFGIGCAAGAPLLRFAQRQGLSEVAGFLVIMVPRAGGRSRHQGKTTWNSVVASLYGWPGTGESGRLRFADRTRVAAGVLFATNCDLTVHLEELQHLARDVKRASAQELTHLIHQVSSGMDRERGARGGGGRRTRGFHVVCFGTAEVDVTMKLPPGSGAHERVMKLPPMFEEESDRNRNEAERLTDMASSHHGHAGRHYLKWLVDQVEENGDEFIREAIRTSIDYLRRDLPTDPSARASAGRLATRAAIGMAGLSFLLDSWGTAQEDSRACLASFVRGWQMVVAGIPTENVGDVALAAVQTYVAENAESIDGLRTSEFAPQRLLGAKTKVTDDHGNKVDVVALTDAAFAAAVSREPFDLDPAQALQALLADGHAVGRTEVLATGAKTVRGKLPIRIGKSVARCICVHWSLLSDNEESEEDEDDSLYREPEF